jgi:hypothetical protein
MAEQRTSTTGLVAVRDRREQVIAALTDHFASDRLDVDEFDRRVDRAHLATSIVELDAVLADLPAVVGAPAPATSQAMVVRDDPNRAKSSRIWMVMGGIERSGHWMVPRTMSAICFWGGGTLDFRDADFGPGVTELNVVAVMGGLEIIVPPWLSVDVDASAIMGGFDERHRAPQAPDPGRPVLRITGLVMMGGVEIETRLAGETKREARKREKREKLERKALDSGRRQLRAGRDDD